MLNSVIMMGRLTDNPELRQTPSGRSVCSFTIAVERTFKAEGAESQTDFFDVVAWGSSADFASKYFNKGQLVAVQGRMETRSYEDRNGVRRKAFNIVAENLHFAEPKRDSYAGGGQPAPSYEDQSQATPAFENNGNDSFREISDGDDDLPF